MRLSVILVAYNTPLFFIYIWANKISTMKKNYSLLAMLIMFASISFAQIPVNGLIAGYPFNGNANDISGYGNNGTVSGATLTTDRFGNSNSAYSFNGSSNYITLGQNAQINNLANDFSVSYWIYLAQVASSNESVITSFSTYMSSTWRFLSRINTSINFDYIGGTVWQYTDYATTLATNTWYNVVFTRIGGTTSLYLNGSLVATGNLSTSAMPTPASPAANTVIGYNVASNSEYFNGKIDDVYFYDRGLYTTEVGQLYSSTTCMQTVNDTVNQTVYDTVYTHVTVYDTTHVTVYDTTYTAVAVTDTLYINAALTGIAPPNNINELRVYPNPAKTDLYIDCGNYASMSGYTIKVTNSIGQVVFSTTITQQQYDINLSSWSGLGIYVLSIYDQSNTVITTKEIVIQ